MAIQWADNFQRYGTSAAYMLNGLYANVQGTILDDPDPSAPAESKAYRINSFGDGESFRRVLSSTQTTVGVAQRIWFDSLPADNQMSVWFVQYNDTGNNNLVSFRVTTTGAIEVRRNSTQYNNGTQLTVTATPVLIANGWQHIETKVFFSSTVGTVTVRVNGIEVIALTGIDTIGTGVSACAQVANWNELNGIGNGITGYTKDYVIWDDTGSISNNFLGSVFVYSLLTDSDDTLTWTPSTGTTGFNLLDNSPPVDGTDYITAASSALAPNVFGLTDVPTDVTSIKGVVLVTRARKTDGGDGNIQAGLVSGASTYLGDDRPITTAFTYFVDVNHTDPATGAAWIPGALNSAKIQLDRTL